MKKPFLSSAALCTLALLIVVGVCLAPPRGSYGSEPAIHQGTILLEGNEIMVIEGPLSINGSIVVVGNATLVLRDATVGFLQERANQWNITLRDPEGGRPRLLVENASIGTDYLMSLVLLDNSSAKVDCLDSPRVSVSLHDDSSAVVVNSTLHYTYPMGRSSFEAIGSTISNGYCRNQATASHVDCTLEAFWGEGGSAEFSGSRVDYVGLFISDANATIEDLAGGHIALYDTEVNLTLEIGPYSSVSDLALTDCEVLTWVFQTGGATNLDISGSELGGLMAKGQTTATISNCSSTAINHIETRTQSRAYVVGSSFDRATARDDSIIWLTESNCSNCQPVGNGKILSPSWFLDVHVRDSAGEGVAGAMVSAASPGDPDLPIRMTDGSGWVRLVLAETVLDPAGSQPAGVYEVTAEWGGHTAQSSIDMKEHSQMELQLEGLVVADGALGPALLVLVGMLSLRVHQRRFSQDG